MNENYILLLFISILIIFCLINKNNTIYSKSIIEQKILFQVCHLVKIV